MATFHHTTSQDGYHRQLKKMATTPPVWCDPGLIRAGLPYAAETQRPYTGINVLLLWLAASSGASATAWRVRPIYSPAGGMNQLRAADGLIVRWVKCTDKRMIVTRFVEGTGAAPLSRAPVPAQVPDADALRTLLLPHVAAVCAKLQQDEPRRSARLRVKGARISEVVAEVAAAFCAAGWQGGERLIAPAPLRPHLGYRLLPVVAGCAQKVADALLAALAVQPCAGGSSSNQTDDSVTPPSGSAPQTNDIASSQAGAATRAGNPASEEPDPQPPPSAAPAEEARCAGTACRVALERLQPGYPGVESSEWGKLLRMQARATLYRYRTPKELQLVLGWRYATCDRPDGQLSIAGIFKLWEEQRVANTTRFMTDDIVPEKLLSRVDELPYWWASGRPYNINRSHVNQRALWRGVNRRLRRARLPGLTDPHLSGFADHKISWEQLATRLVVPGCYTRQGRRKRDGSVRWLHVPSVELAKVQRVISALVMKAIRPTANACAFLPRRSILPHVYAHAGAQVALICDIKDFFGSVRPEQIRAALKMRRSPFPPESHEAILRLVTWADGAKPPGLPQGAPSSPAFSNWIAFLFDWRVQRDLEEAFGAGVAQYTRYADDLVLSSTVQVEGFAERALEIVRRSVRRMGWWLNSKKTRTWSSVDGPLQICGLNVPGAAGEAITLPRAWKRRLRVALHKLRGVAPDEKGEPELLRAARGTVACAYAMTGDARLLADCAARVGKIAEALHLDVDAFREGWRDTQL